jgi:hypothetical protein
MISQNLEILKAVHTHFRVIWLSLRNGEIHVFDNNIKLHIELYY